LCSILEVGKKRVKEEDLKWPPCPSK